MTEKEYQTAIQQYEWDELKEMWHKRHDNNFPKEWKKGKFFEYAILRAFELEGAKVLYPYNVDYPQTVIAGEEVVEQIDGVIYTDNLCVIAESKDYSRKNIDIEPLAKLQVRLKRRPATVIGCLFTASDFTWPALALIETLMPYTILLWNNSDIEYCFENRKFLEGLKLKYRNMIEKCNHMFDLTAFAQLNGI